MLLLVAIAAGCTPRSGVGTHPHTQLGRVVMYRSGVAYYERKAKVESGKLTVSVPRRLVDDFLKSLTVRDGATGEAIAATFERKTSADETVTMAIAVPGNTRSVILTYISEAPAWKPSYRVRLADTGQVEFESWAIVDNVSGEDWKDVLVGVGSSAAMSFRYDLWSVRSIARTELANEARVAIAPPDAVTPHRTANPAQVVTGRVAMQQTQPQSESRRSRAAAKSPRPMTSGPGSGGSYGDDGDGDGALSEMSTEIDKVDQRDRSDTQAAPIDSIAAQVRGHNRLVNLRAQVADSNQCADATLEAEQMRARMIDAGVGAANAVVTCDVTGAKDLVYEITDLPAADEGTTSTSESPVGEALFLAEAPMTVANNSSAMVSVFQAKTQGDVAYLYDPSPARGNREFAFRAVRLTNPSASMLERGPVTFYGDGRFVGEGILDAVPGLNKTVIPFALDRQVVVEPKQETASSITAILALTRHGMRVQMTNVQTLSWTVTNRSQAATTVFIKHLVPHGHTLDTGTFSAEVAGQFRLVEAALAAGETKTITVEQRLPYERILGFDQRTNVGLVESYLKAAPGAPFAQELAALVSQAATQGTIDMEIEELTEQVDIASDRERELREQIDALRKSKASGALLQELQRRLATASRRAGQITLALESAHERRLTALIRFRELVADLANRPNKPAPTTTATNQVAKRQP